MGPRAILLAAGSLSLCSWPAQAQPHHVCLYLDIGADLWDASPRASDGEDFREEYGRNEGLTSFPAQRWLARVRDESTGAVVFGWRPLDGTGCAAFDLDHEADLTLEWTRWALWNDQQDTGNQIVGYRCDEVLDDCRLDIGARTVPADMLTGVTNVFVQRGERRPVDVVLWAASFAEERFASLGEQPLENMRLYVGYDPKDLLRGATQADRTFGNQPSVVIDADSWHSKFTVAHELGHQQTIAAMHPAFGPGDLNYCYSAPVYPAAPHNCRPNHATDSHEWQAVAAVEGIAHWYAVSVWNDVDIVECQNCQPGVRYVSPFGPDQAQTIVVPRGEPLCTALDQPQCPAGVGNEWDWLSAFRLFRLASPNTGFRTMLGMMSAAYDSGGWIVASPTDAFWTSFDQAMSGQLGSGYQSWRAAAAEMELDR